ncbi:hypothetical protein [Pseudomonas sp. S1Bt23]|uniref:hypothetical protein n=1 Tax=Pseudomonas sp. S1Bt23 TaxID=3095074 RepID=UPI002A5991E5|nr:hypothetical protein [Pseudomonas sp. S1Bt23]WPO46403.1 hypothetical protein SHB59_24490 [Pseudomonas sp. S1Bt23]
MTARKRFIVKKKNISDALAGLPELEVLDDQYIELDIFIGACGFEERILAVPTALIERKVKVNQKILLGVYETNPSDNNKRKKELIPKLKKLGKVIEYFDAESPEETYRAVSVAIGERSNGQAIKVGLDISGSSATLIMSVIFSLIRTGVDINLRIFYTTAALYHEPTAASLDEPVAVWSPSDLREVGVIDVSANELAPGIQHDHLPSYVIALPSMFPARLQRGLSFLGIGTLSGADENVYWVLPTTDDPKHQWRQEQVKHSLLDMIYGDSEGETPPVLPAEQWGHCDVLDYRGCIRLIMNQIESHSSSNISVIHSGTKVQAVGVALALSARREVALIKSRPQSFSADHYSGGVGSIYMIHINSLQGVTLALSEVGSFNVENN